MLRFKPDGLLEGLLRPFIMVDPVAGVYFEEMAPDLRFAALALLMVAALLAALWRATRPGAETATQPSTHPTSVVWRSLPLHAGQWRALAALGLMMYAWTFAIGNGRYFLGGLLLVGPVLTMLCRFLPGTMALRCAALLLVLGMQTFAVWLTYTPNTWGLARWTHGSGMDMQDHALREEPAIFLTLGGISYSIMVPRFHRQSRWANISGQRDIVSGTTEFRQLQSLLSARLPRYAVMAINREQSLPNGQPGNGIRSMLTDGLAPHALQLSRDDCYVLRSTLATTMADEQGKENPRRGFWFCPVVSGAGDALQQADPQPAPIAVFEMLEERCPRFFPPGDSKLRRFGDVWARHYTGSDMRVYVDGQGNVLYRYFRAMNPSFLGTADQVLRGEFELNCNKLPGRYVPPWQRD